MKMRKILAILSALCMMCAVMPVNGNALDTTSVSTEQNYQYWLQYEITEDNTVTITECHKDAAAIEIPAKIDGLPVTKIGTGAFRQCYQMTSVIIPDTVTEIGAFAFSDCYSLTDITIPDSVTAIKDAAFQDCRSLTSVIIPDSVTEIEAYAFNLCSALTSVTIGGNVKTIPTYAFASCIALTDVVIPEGTETVSRYAFDHCMELKSLSLPSTLKEFHLNAIDECFQLAEIHVAEGGAFYSSQDGILFNADKTELLRCPPAKSAETYSIPETVTAIADTAFGQCTALTSVTIPEGVTSIGESAFHNCYNLTGLVLPESLTSIGAYAFCNCAHLTEIRIPENVTALGSNAFNNCTRLISAEIPANVPNISTQTFYNCQHLKDITILNPNAFIYDSASVFSNTERTFTGTIHGYEDSTAKFYAEKYGYAFASLGDAPETSLLTAGDLNNDGSIDIRDAVLINKAIFGKNTLTKAQLNAVDFNHNGMPDAEDALTLMKYIVRLIDSLE